MEGASDKLGRNSRRIGISQRDIPGMLQLVRDKKHETKGLIRCFDRGNGGGRRVHIWQSQDIGTLTKLRWPG